MSDQFIKIICVILVLVSSGCTFRGGLYTHTVKPYTQDFQDTPVGTRSHTFDVQKVKEPLTGYGISAEWGEAKIFESAHANGIEVIHHIDLEVFSLFFELYKRQRYIIHGS